MPLDVFKVPAMERKDDEFEVGVCAENVARTGGAENDLGSNGGASRGSLDCIIMTGGFNSRSASLAAIGIPAMPSNETPRKLEEDEILEINKISKDLKVKINKVWHNHEEERIKEEHANIT